ncbi:MAG: class I SAM-dependent methyltransferase [Chitinophagaceae bacterium]
MEYISYFFYLAWNWNLRLACFVVYHELKGEKKYLQHTIGINNLKTEVTEEQRAHASIYQPINYYTAERLFDQTYLEDLEGSLLDMGCGKGRIFGIGAMYGFRHIIGVDFSPTLCSAARTNAKKLMAVNDNIIIEVICADAVSYMIPDSVTTIFLFNPFDHSVMRKMLGQLNESLKRKARPIKVLYANPVCKNLFTEAGFSETFYFKKFIYLEGSVLENG